MNFHTKDQKRNGSGNHHYSMLRDTVLVSDDDASSPKFPSSTSYKCFDTTSNKGLQHPLYPKMKLLAVHLSGRPSVTQNFHQKLLKLSWNRGDHQQGPGVSQCLNDGTGMQYREMKIPILQM